MSGKLNKNIPKLRFPEFKGDNQARELNNVIVKKDDILLNNEEE
ncbi:hypothetical protein [Brunnivagina elsteri]|nr:hypothetical protein [Calothrix elsteri]